MSSDEPAGGARERPHNGRPTDAEIRAIAVRIRAAMRYPVAAPPGDPPDGILSPAHELRPEDEDRVVAALLELGAADAEDAPADRGD